MRNNLLNLGQLLEKGISIQMEDNHMKLFDQSGKLILKSLLSRNKTLKIELQIGEQKCLATLISDENWK